MWRYLATKMNAEYDPDNVSEILCYWAPEEWYTCHSTTMFSRYCAESARMRLVISGATIFKKGMSVLDWKPLAQTITVPEVQERSTVRFIAQLRRLAANDDKWTESSAGKHTYRWINTHTRRRASQRTPQSETLSSPSIRWTTNIPANTPEKR